MLTLLACAPENAPVAEEDSAPHHDSADTGDTDDTDDTDDTGDTDDTDVIAGCRAERAPAGDRAVVVSFS